MGLDDGNGVAESELDTSAFLRIDDRRTRRRQRTVGALVGTGAGTVLGGLFQTGSRTALVALFAVLALAAAARPYGYLFWSAGVTAALVFLYSYFGESGADLLARRLLGIAVGGAIGMTAAWFVLPVRRRGRSIRLGGPGNRPPPLDT